MLAFFKKLLLPGLSLEQMSLLKQTDPAQHFLDASFFQRRGTHSITLPQNLENPAKSTATTVVPVTSALDRHPNTHTSWSLKCKLGKCGGKRGRKGKLLDLSSQDPGQAGADAKHLSHSVKLSWVNCDTVYYCAVGRNFLIPPFLIRIV